MNQYKEKLDQISRELPIKKQLLRRYIRYVLLKIHVQHNKRLSRSGNNYSVKPASVGAGRSRQKRGVISGVKRMVLKAPHSKGGRMAHPFVSKAHIKINKKEKKLAIKHIFCWLNKQNKIVLFDNSKINTDVKESFFKNFDKNFNISKIISRINIVDFNSPIDQYLKKSLKNLKNVFLVKSNNFFDLIKGYEPHYLYISTDYLKWVLDHYF